MNPTSDQVFGALPEGAQLLEYRIEKILGHGGFGITYLAHDTQLDARFAIKEFLPPDLAARGSAHSVTVRSETTREPFEWAKDKFLNEARVLARFSHPNLVRVTRFFRANGTVYFVMDFIEGETLGSALRRENTLPEERVREIVLPLVSGLADVHEAGVLHRDIKPGNIIVRSDGSPVLIDFGAARQSFNSVSKSMLNVVTAGYAPIEQYSEDLPQGPWTDIYALGAVTYRMLFGKKIQDAISRLQHDPVLPAREAGAGRFAPEWLAALDWALALHPQDRPQSLAQWRQALNGEIEPPQPEHSAPRTPTRPTVEAEGESTEVLPPAGEADRETTEVLPRAAEPPPAGRKSSRRRWATGLALAMAVAAVTAAVWILRPLSTQGPAARPPPDSARVITPQPSPTSTAPAATTAAAPAPSPSLQLARELAPRGAPTTLELIASGEHQLEAGARNKVVQVISQRLRVNPGDSVALTLRGHLAFLDKRRDAGLADYARALEATPQISSNITVARNLAAALGWATEATEGLIKAHTSPEIIAALGRRSGQPGKVGRGHAVRILTELGQAKRIDRLAYAKLELVEQVRCEDRIAAIKILREVGDASVIPLLEEQIPGWVSNMCIRGEVNRTIEALQKQR